MQRTAYLLIAVILLPMTLTAQNRTEPANALTLSVSGVGTSSANPDLLQMQIAVVTRDMSAQKAADENARLVTGVLAALRSQLGAGSSITTVSYTLEPQYTYPPQGGEPQFAGFLARNAMRIETADLNKAGQLIDAAIASGANSVTDIRYTLRNETKLKTEALTAASREARAKADALAAANGVRIVGVRTIDESSRFSPMPYLNGGAQRAEMSTPIVTGPVEAQATVTIVYEITR